MARFRRERGPDRVRSQDQLEAGSLGLGREPAHGGPRNLRVCRHHGPRGEHPLVADRRPLRSGPGLRALGDQRPAGVRGYIERSRLDQADAVAPRKDQPSITPRGAPEADLDRLPGPRRGGSGRVAGPRHDREPLQGRGRGRGEADRALKRRGHAVPFGDEPVNSVRGNRQEGKESPVGSDLHRCPVDGQPGPSGTRRAEEEVSVAHGEGGALSRVADLEAHIAVREGDRRKRGDALRPRRARHRERGHSPGSSSRGLRHRCRTGREGDGPEAGTRKGEAGEPPGSGALRAGSSHSPRVMHAWSPSVSARADLPPRAVPHPMLVPGTCGGP